MSDDFRGLATGLFPAMVAAGARTMDYFGTEAGATLKGDGSPVTLADQAAEVVLHEALRVVAPNIPVVAEEAAAAGNIPDVGNKFFLVDPLDGTKEFIGGRNEFTVNVGLIDGGTPVFGMIYAPALGKMFVTLSADHVIVGEVRYDDRECTLEQFETKAARITTRTTPTTGGMTIVASRSHGSDALEAWLSDVAVAGRANMGSSLKLCLVAQGEADIYPRFGPTKEWDTAAGHAIVLAAGGLVTLEDCATPLTYGKVNEDYLNPYFIVWGRSDNAVRAQKIAAG